MLHNIPEELRILPQWVVWRYEKNENGKLTKVPYSVRGYKASSTDPSSWCDFDTAVAIAEQWGADGIGFVLSVNDEYTIIDLDNKPENPATPEQIARHQKILAAFQSYTELSTSGTGVHIIVKGSVPHGRNKDHVEVYSQSRFMVMTGNVVRDLPIVEAQEMLDHLWAEMETADDNERVQLTQIDSEVSDEEIVEMALNAENGEKFDRLTRMTAGPDGTWRDEYGSQSEADLALMSIIAFYTRDNEQVRRIFRMTGLGKREKALKNDTYLNYNLGLIRAKEPPPVDLSQMSFIPPVQAQDYSYVETHLATPVIESPALPSPGFRESGQVDLLNPPGILGDIAQYIYEASPRPCKELAVPAALAMLAGITARAYNISNSGLNQYFVVLAPTGTGKEAMQMGIDNLFAHARVKVPMIDQFMGPGAFASGQGFDKLLVDQPCFVSVLGEFGHLLDSLLSPRASEHQVMLKASLLKAFSSSGPSQVYKGRVYSNKENNVKPVRAPNVSFLGECTAEKFFSALSDEFVTDGFIPRLLINEYQGRRAHLNVHAGFAPNPNLVQAVADIATASIQVQSQNSSVFIQQDDATSRLLLEYSRHIDLKMDALPEGAIKHILNRSHLKALRLAGLLAVGTNPYQPVVTKPLADWAIAYIERADRIITTRFEAGEIGEGDTLFEPVVRKAIEFYRRLTPDQRIKSADCPTQLAHLDVVPFSSIRDYCKRREPFKSHRLGYSRALEIALADLCAAGVLIEIMPSQLPMTRNGKKMKAYGLDEGYWKKL